MSLRATLWVLDGAAHITDPVEVLVLLAIADEANDDGEGARLGVATIAARARIEKRSAQRVLARLADRGQLVIDRSDGGRGRWSTYRLVMTDPTNGDPGTPLPDAETTTERRPNDDRAGSPTNDGPAPEKLPPNPPQAGGKGAHRGQHPNCRACGTNPRGPAPPDVDAYRTASVNDPDRRRENPCRQCGGDKMIDAVAGGLMQCPRCGGSGIEPSRRVS